MHFCFFFLSLNRTRFRFEIFYIFIHLHTSTWENIRNIWLLYNNYGSQWELEEFLGVYFPSSLSIRYSSAFRLCYGNDTNVCAASIRREYSQVQRTLCGSMSSRQRVWRSRSFRLRLLPLGILKVRPCISRKCHVQWSNTNFDLITSKTMNKYTFLPIVRDFWILFSSTGQKINNKIKILLLARNYLDWIELTCSAIIFIPFIYSRKIAISVREASSVNVNSFRNVDIRNEIFL